MPICIITIGRASPIGTRPRPPLPPVRVRRNIERCAFFSFADAAESDAPSGGKKKRKKRRARDLAAASSVVASKMDYLMDALRVRDLTVAIQTSRRTAAERERMRDAAAKVAAAHESAAVRHDPLDELGSRRRVGGGFP